MKVDNIVTVDGLGIHSDGSDPTPLKFRCGYVGQQMLAFSWNDPVPACARRALLVLDEEIQGKSHRGKGKAKASGRTGSKKAVTTKSRAARRRS